VSEIQKAKRFTIGLGRPCNASYDNDEHNRLIVFKKSGDETAFEIRIREKLQPFYKYYHLNTPLAATTTFGEKEARVFETPNGYCDSPGCSSSFIAYSIERDKNTDVYTIVFFSDTTLTNIEQEILNSFSFAD